MGGEAYPYLEEAVLHVQLKSGQIRRLSTPHPLVQPALVLVVPASYHRLADEAGHDDQAGLSDITIEQSMTSRHQHKPAASTAACGQQWPVTPQM